ncbi:hypothetical protein LguiB_004917 [Lonicera macranthoides]
MWHLLLKELPKFMELAISWVLVCSTSYHYPTIGLGHLLSAGTATAEQLAVMGMQLLAGSAMMMLTLVWGACVAFGSSYSLTGRSYFIFVLRHMKHAILVCPI